MKTQIPENTIFNHAVKHLLKLEGGYVNDPLDAGGETNYGISKRQYPHLEIASLSVADAIAIYYRDYWQMYQCDEIEKYSSAIACFLFDSVVNHRPKTAIKFLQSALKVSVDGIIGKQTLGGIKQISHNRDLTSAFVIRCFMYRADFYHDLVIDNPSQDRFFMGWMRRLFSLQQFIDCEIFKAKRKSDSKENNHD